VHRDDHHRGPARQRKQLAQHPLEGGGVVVKVDGELDEDEVRRRGELRLEAVFEEGRAGGGKRAVVIRDGEVGSRRAEPLQRCSDP